LGSFLGFYFSFLGFVFCGGFGLILGFAYCLKLLI